MSEDWKLLKREQKPKLKKTNISGKNLMKNFRELLKETRSNLKISIKTAKMETDKKNKGSLPKYLRKRSQ